MNRRVIAFCIGLILVLGGIWMATNSTKQASDQSPKSQTESNLTASSDAARFSEDYPLVDQNNRFKYATPAEILEIFEQGSGIIFLGFPGCPWCQQFAPILDRAAKQHGIPVIYYLNTRETKQDSEAEYQEIFKKLQPHLKKDEAGNPRLYVPDISAVHKGEIVGRFKQEATKQGEKASSAAKYWEDEGRQERANKQLEDMIKKYKTPSGLGKALNQPDSHLIDVRTTEEFNQGHIKDAKNVPLVNNFASALPNQVTKGSAIYVYCRSGNRSYQAARQLIEAGYKNVYDLGSLADVQTLGGELAK